MLAYFVSDIHLRSMQEVNARLFTRFLKSLSQKEGVTSLFLVGDIFDFWISDHTYYIRKFEPIVREIERIASEGIDVHYFEGNHDLYLHKYWMNRLGVKVYEDYHVFDLGDLRVRVEHGDLIDRSDKGYRFLRKLLRTNAMRFVAENVPENIISKIGEQASQASRLYTSTYKVKAPEQMLQKIHHHAHEKVKETEFDILVTGHVHIKDDYEFLWHDKTVRSINLGSWLTEPCAFRITEKSQEFIKIV